MPTLTFKATPAEVRAIRDAARRRRQNVSAYLRSTALAPAAALAPRARLVRSRKTGALVITTSSGSPVLSADEVRAGLTGFP